jgi:N-acetylmuramoyl-L-alanine amidase
MKIIHDFSPNFETNTIDVTDIVLHYTGCDLPHVLDIFHDRNSKVTSHFAIDTNGDTVDFGKFFHGEILQGAHAGKSTYVRGNALVEKFNARSIGIELVNLNGNAFGYTDAQYASLSNLVRHLAKRFPALADPEAILGHEHIAAFRGKADPGIMFDWRRFFLETYGTLGPERTAVCTPAIGKALQEKIAAARESERADRSFWTSVSTWLEAEVAKVYSEKHVH